MKNSIIKQTAVVAALCFPLFAQAQNQPETIIEKYGKTMSLWCSSKDNDYRIELDKVVKEKGCRVDNKVMDSFIENTIYELSNLGKGSFMMDSYLNCIQTAIKIGSTYTHGKPVWQKDYKEPTAYNDKKDEPLYFVSMDYAYSGGINTIGTDLFFIRGQYISKVIDFNDTGSLAAAIKFYSEGKNSEAFNIFRKLAYANPSNYDAQYYLAVMEVRKMGCGALNKNFRDMEAAWWITRGLLLNRNHDEWALDKLNKLYYRFNIDVSQIPYYIDKGNGYFLEYIFTKPLVSEGLMVYKDKKGKYGFMSENGTTVVPCRYDLVVAFDETGLAKVVRNNKTGFVNKNGIEVVPVVYDNVMADFLGNHTYVLKGDRLVLLDINGNVVRDLGNGFDNLGEEFINGKAYIHHKESGLYHLYDSNGNYVGNSEKIFYIDKFRNCYYTINEDKKRDYEQPFW